jgi:hypothetical protein
MSKAELKTLYKLNKISTKEYFMQLCRIIRSESSPVTVSVSPTNVDLTAIFDGKLPL